MLTILGSIIVFVFGVVLAFIGTGMCASKDASLLKKTIGAILAVFGLIIAIPKVLSLAFTLVSIIVVICVLFEIIRLLQSRL